RCLVIGAGTVGQSKIQSLLVAGANVAVIAPQGTSLVREWAENRLIEWEVREFEASDLNDVFLVIAATNCNAINQIIFREAQKRNILCNSVDDPVNCDFYYPAVVRRGDLQIAISTAGKSPALAQRIRQELEKKFGPEYESWVVSLGKQREELAGTDLDADARKRILHELASHASFEARNVAQEGGRN